jgi:2-amino-4-hydroxy-6-hydroxymethyldihydropteridine diphosphokinase
MPAASNPVNTVAYIGIGSNLGDASGHVTQAFDSLGALAQTALTGRSSLFRTAPIDAGGDDYINAAARLETGLAPQDLLAALQSIEQACGRERPFRNAPRTLDLDILLYGSQTIATGSLNVPHPRLTERAFALIPLLQIDPFVVIPGKGPAHMFVPGIAGQAIRKM